MKKMISLMTLIAMMSSFTTKGEAAIFCESTGGCGYEECRAATCLAPAIALSTVALLAIVAVIVQNRDSGNSHSHSH